MRRKLALTFQIIALMVFVTFLIITQDVYGQSTGWSQPIPISPEEQSGWFPDISVDSTGQIYVVWASGIKGSEDTSYDAIFYAASQDGQNWSEPIDIVLPELGRGEATRPTLYYDQKEDVLHMAYRGTKVYYSQATGQKSTAKDWLSPRQVSLEQVAYFSQVALDQQGIVHLIFTENVVTEECPICFHIFHRKSDDNGLSWSNLVEISKLPTGAAKPQLLIDEQDNLHVVWEAGIGGSYGQLSGPTKAMYSVSYDGGETWAYPTEFVTPGGEAKNVTIGLDGQGKLITAWQGFSENLIYYQSSSDKGQSWSPPHSIPDVSTAGTRLDTFAMATDNVGNVHLIFVGKFPSDQEKVSNVIHLVWDGQTWSQPEAIATFYGDLPEWPRIAVGNGNNLHVAWYVRDEKHIWDSDNQQYRIWYSQKIADAPRIMPASPRSTSTPIPSPVPPISTSIVTPNPTLAADIANISLPAGTVDSIYTENDELLLLLQSLIPAVIVIVLVLGGVRIWRR